MPRRKRQELTSGYESWMHVPEDVRAWLLKASGFGMTEWVDAFRDDLQSGFYDDRITDLAQMVLDRISQAFDKNSRNFAWKELAQENLSLKTRASILVKAFDLRELDNPDKFVQIDTGEKALQIIAEYSKRELPAKKKVPHYWSPPTTARKDVGVIPMANDPELKTENRRRRNSKVKVSVVKPPVKGRRKVSRGV